MNSQRNWYNSTKKTSYFTKPKMDIIEPKDKAPTTQTAEQYSKLYDINDLPLKNFDKCLSGHYEYMTVDGTKHPDAHSKFMDIYFTYIEQVGGGGQWSLINREYADLNIRSIMLNFSKDLIIKGMYEGSEVKKMMLEYDYTLPHGHEIAMIDSYLATLQLSLDSITKQMSNLNKSKGGESSIVAILTQINNVNKVYLPYNSILLIEFIEAYKLLKETIKKSKNGRPN